MDIHQLNSVSPLRVFEDSIHGGLGKGNLGVIVSKHGVGKTACLVHLATDKLFKNENVIHVSFSGNVEHVMNWYKEVFREIAEKQSLEDATMVYEQILAKRVIMNFSQNQVTIDKVISSLETLINLGSFKADAILFDGYKIGNSTKEDLEKLKAFAAKLNLEIWLSATPVGSSIVFDEYGVPDSLSPLENLIDVLVALRYNDQVDKVIITVVRAHNEDVPKPAKVALDPKTMLIARK